MKSAIKMLTSSEEIIEPHEATFYDSLICSNCREPVSLIIQGRGSHFAHRPSKYGTPSCWLRAKWYSSGPRSPAPPKPGRIVRQDIFRRLLRVHYGVVSLPTAASSDKKIIDELRDIVERYWFNNGKTIDISSLALPTKTDPMDWTAVMDFIQSKISELWKIGSHGGPKYESLTWEEYTRLVLHLWNHLNLNDLARDIRFLLELSSFLMNSGRISIPAIGKSQPDMLLWRLMYGSLEVLKLVPWSAITLMLIEAHYIRCAGCNRYFAKVPRKELEPCSTCHRAICLTCAENYRCVKCHELLCKTCAAKHVC